MKRIILFSYFLFISFFCFAQQSLPAKIIGGIPSASSSKKYQIQVGAYRQEKNAQDAILRLKRAGLESDTETFRNLTRVIVRDVPASRVRSVLSSIAKAGFREVIVREDSPSKAEPYDDASPVRPENNYRPPEQENTYDPAAESNYNPSAQESYFVPSTQVSNPRRSDILCKTWKIDKCPNPELIGSRFYILDDGTYYVTNPRGESSSFSEWRRSGGNEFEYSHNGWEYFGKAEITNLTDNYFELIDSGYNYNAPGNSPAGYRNIWVFSLITDDSSER
jgi:hypothetical protein